MDDLLRTERTESEAYDNHIVSLAMQGDKAAFEQLFIRSYRAMYNVVSHFLTNDENIYDALQDGYLKAYRKLNTLSAPEAFYSWLTVIMKNSARDILRELARPGRDIRDDLPKPVLRTDVMTMDDLTEGMELTGTVRNVVDFGAFVDIGVHEDGLVHVSQFPSRVRHPSQAVSIGDVVTVWVLSVDKPKKRISLTMRKGK